MPTTINDFNNPSRLIRCLVEVDLDGNGSFENYTSSVDNFTILWSTQDQIYGLIDGVIDIELFIPNPPASWSKPGLAVRASIITSNDNWTTQHTEQLFVGSTVRQNSIPTNTIKIRATTQNTNYFDQKISRRIYRNMDVNDIITNIVEAVGVSNSQINLQSTGVIIPVYGINDSVPVKDYINDLCKPTLQVVGFSRNGFFEAASLQQLTVAGLTITPNVTTSRNTITEYQNQELSSKYYANTIQVKGNRFEYIELEQLFYDNQIQGQEIKPNDLLYYTQPLDDLLVTEFNNFRPRNRPNAGSAPFVGGYRRDSFYDFFTADDGSGAADNVGITLLSQSLVNDNGKDTLFLKFKNTGSTSRFLKVIVLNGSGVKKVGEFFDGFTNEATIFQDGGEQKIDIDSNAIQNEVVMANCLTTLTANITQYADVYTFEDRGKPFARIGSIIQFEDRNGNTKQGVIYELDIEVSPDQGYTQLITAKTLVPVNYLQLDNANEGLDDINYSIF